MIYYIYNLKYSSNNWQFGRHRLLLLTKSAILEIEPKKLGQGPRPLTPAIPERMYSFPQETIPKSIF